jgi:deoxyribodipyrimidine photo-lyase
MSKPVIIMWFRHDLRLKDNPALFHAVDIAQNTMVDGVKATVLPIYIQDETAPAQAQPGGAS